MAYSSIPPLPQELTDMIIDYLYYDLTTLRSCAVVCRTWTNACRHHLFEKVSLLVRPETLPNFMQLLETSLGIGGHIKSLTLCGKKYQLRGHMEVQRQLCPHTVHTVIHRLPRLSVLNITEASLTCRCQGKTSLPFTIPDTLHSINTLHLTHCSSLMSTVSHLVSIFSHISTLSMSNMNWNEWPVSNLSAEHPTIDINSVDLSADHPGTLEELFVCFRKFYSRGTMQSARIKCSNWLDVKSFGEFLSWNGPGLHEIDLDITGCVLEEQPFLPPAAEWHALGLSSCETLRSISFDACLEAQEIFLGEPIDDNKSLFVTFLDIISILPPLTESITFKLSFMRNAGPLTLDSCVEWERMVLELNKLRSLTRVVFVIEDFSKTDKPRFPFGGYVETIERGLSNIRSKGILRIEPSPHLKKVMAFRAEKAEQKKVASLLDMSDQERTSVQSTAL